MFFSTFRVSHERKSENKNHEELPESHHSSHGQDKEGVWLPGSRTEEAEEDPAAEEGPFLSKTELQKDTQGRRAQPCCTYIHCGHKGVYKTGPQI